MRYPCRMASQKTLVWDLPIRLFHWALALAVVGAFVTVKLEMMEWHGRLGGLALALLLFRVLWGFLGSSTARFVNFVPTPTRLAAYLRGDAPAAKLGHSPLGALAVLAMLLLFSMQALAGLGTTDEVLYDGPLVRVLPSDWVERASWLHHTMEPVLIAMVLMHLLAIAFYRVRRGRDLLGPMLKGYADAPDPHQAGHPHQAGRVLDSGLRRVLALVLFGLCGLLVWLVFTQI